MKPRSLLVALLPLVALAETPIKKFQARDTGATLVNPAMGWTMHYYSNIPSNYGPRLEPSDTLDDFPDLSTVYLCLPWAILDTHAQRWIAKGKRIAIRITCSENWMPHATPEWVKAAGAKGTYYQLGKGRVEPGGPLDPFFDDSVFVEKLGRFLAALATRYDGTPVSAMLLSDDEGQRRYRIGSIRLDAGAPT
jgi:hypothetical protein